MKKPQRVALIVLLALGLFSGRSLLLRALRPEPAQATARQHLESVTLDPAIPRGLAVDLSHAAGSADPELSEELLRASWACARIAEALEDGHPLAASAARAAVARAHGDLGRAHLARAQRSYARGDRLGAASDLRVAVRELDLAAALEQEPEQEPRIRDVLAVARRLEEGGEVTDQEFGGSTDSLGRALATVASDSTRAAATADAPLRG